MQTLRSWRAACRRQCGLAHLTPINLNHLRLQRWKALTRRWATMTSVVTEDSPPQDQEPKQIKGLPVRLGNKFAAPLPSIASHNAGVPALAAGAGHVLAGLSDDAQQNRQHLTVRAATLAPLLNCALLRAVSFTMQMLLRLWQLAKLLSAPLSR